MTSFQFVKTNPLIICEQLKFDPIVQKVDDGTEGVQKVLTNQ